MFVDFDTPTSKLMKNAYRSPLLALNVKRRNEPVATETFYCDTCSIDDGSKCAQAFFGTKTVIYDVYGIKYDKKFVNSLK